MHKVKLLKQLTVSIVIFGNLLVQQQIRASIITYSDESTYTLSVNTYGPLNAPFVGGNVSSVNVSGFFTVTPGPGVAAIGVGNVIGDTMPSDLMVEGQSFSNLDFSFLDLQNTFGFGIVSYTAPGYVGLSTFEVTIYDGITNVGSTNFSTPLSGEVFFGFKSTLTFDSLTLREIAGDVQEATQFGGPADREWFGKFYVTPVPAAGILGILGLGVAGLKLRKYA